MTEVKVTSIYDKEIEYLSYTLDDARTNWVHVPAKVMATFKELSRTDISQHKLAMFITRTFRKFDMKVVEEANGDTPAKMKIEVDDEAVYDLVVRYLDTCSVYTTEYTEQVKKEILADVGAIYKFGFWLLSEKIAPFFSSLQTTSAS